MKERFCRLLCFLGFHRGPFSPADSFHNVPTEHCHYCKRDFEL